LETFRGGDPGVAFTVDSQTAPDHIGEPVFDAADEAVFRVFIVGKAVAKQRAEVGIDMVFPNDIRLIIVFMPASRVIVVDSDVPCCHEVVPLVHE